MSGHIYVISGPSGAGKSSIIGLLKRGFEDLGYCISHTSRSPRGQEVSGVDYHFIDEETFHRMIHLGAFVEWAEVYGDLYGTSSSSLQGQIDEGKDVLMDVDSQGARNIRKAFKETTLIYILPPSMESLKERLLGRATDDDEVIEARMTRAVKELENCLWYDYLIINNDLDAAADKAAAIITAQRCLARNMYKRVKTIFNI